MVDSTATLNFRDIGLWAIYSLVDGINHIVWLNWAVYVLAQNFILRFLFCFEMYQGNLIQDDNLSVCKFVTLTQLGNVRRCLTSVHMWGLHPALPGYGRSYCAHVSFLSWSQKSQVGSGDNVGTCPSLVVWRRAFWGLNLCLVFLWVRFSPTRFINVSCSSIPNVQIMK